MKLRSKLLMFTATTALYANMAFAAIDTQALADGFIADGYSYVEIKTGPTQTKLEAVKDATKLEVIYDNETGAVIKQESSAVDDDYAGQTGVEIEDTDDDFTDGNDDGVDDDGEDHDRGHGNDDDHDDADNPGKGGGNHGSDDGHDGDDDGDDDAGDDGDGDRGGKGGKD
jgi:hypothetical protein